MWGQVANAHVVTSIQPVHIQTMICRRSDGLKRLYFRQSLDMSITCSHVISCAVHSPEVPNIAESILTFFKRVIRQCSEFMLFNLDYNTAILDTLTCFSVRGTV